MTKRVVISKHIRSKSGRRYSEHSTEQQEQLVSKFQKTQFVLQLSESTLPVYQPLLVAYIRFVIDSANEETYCVQEHLNLHKAGQHFQHGIFTLGRKS